MAVFVLPSLARKLYTFQVPLDGKLFRLDFVFNERDEFWYFDISDALNGTLIRAGLKVVSSWDVMRLCQSANRPAGPLIPVSQGDTGAEANTLEALGTDVLMTYIGES